MILSNYSGAKQTYPARLTVPIKVLIVHMMDFDGGVTTAEEIRDRYFIIKFHSVIYKLFSAPKCNPLSHNTWSKVSCYIGITISSFENVIIVAFDTVLIECESDFECKNATLVNFAHYHHLIAYNFPPVVLITFYFFL